MESGVNTVNVNTVQSIILPGAAYEDEDFAQR